MPSWSSKLLSPKLNPEADHTLPEMPGKAIAKAHGG